MFSLMASSALLWCNYARNYIIATLINHVAISKMEYETASNIMWTVNCAFTFRILFNLSIVFFSSSFDDSSHIQFCVWVLLKTLWSFILSEEIIYLVWNVSEKSHDMPTLTKQTFSKNNNCLLMKRLYINCLVTSREKNYDRKKNDWNKTRE